MNIIEPSIEYIPQGEGLEGIFKQIELAGRVCYKSEDRITENSAKQFVAELIKRGHLSPLEHGAVYLEIPVEDIMNDFFYEDNPYSFTYSDGKTLLVSTNYRVIVENDRIGDLKYLTTEVILLDKKVTFRIICSRAIANELVRHRIASFSQESTRYCNYSKDKFGNELTFIKPQCDISSNAYYDALKAAEQYYFELIKSGLKAQFARDILPLATKTELIMTATLYQWQDIYSLRSSVAAHPDMRCLMNMIKPTIDSLYNK